MLPLKHRRSIQNAINAWLSASQFTSPLVQYKCRWEPYPSFAFPLAAGFLCMLESTGFVASSLAAGVILFLDFLWCFNAECEWIWKRQPNMIRMAYIFSRIFPALALLAHLVLLNRFRAPLDLKPCRSWFLFLHSSSACMQVVLTVILYVRICALHRNEFGARILSICAAVVETVVVFGGGLLLFHQAEFDEQCSARPKMFGYALPVVFLVNQSLAWGLTWYGRYLLSREFHPLGNTEMHRMIPFLPILFRDSSIVVSVAMLGFALAVPYTATAGIQTLSIYPWSMTGLSCFSCHLILNLFRVERPAPQVEITDPNLELMPIHLEPPLPVYLHPARDVAMEFEGPLSSSGTILSNLIG